MFSACSNPRINPAHINPALFLSESGVLGIPAPHFVVRIDPFLGSICSRKPCPSGSRGPTRGVHPHPKLPQRRIIAPKRLERWTSFMARSSHVHAQLALFIRSIRCRLDSSIHLNFIIDLCQPQCQVQRDPARRPVPSSLSPATSLSEHVACSRQSVLSCAVTPMQVCLAHEAYFIHALAYLIHSPELPQAGTGPAEPLKSPASESCGATRTARLEGSSWGRGPTGPTP